MHGPRAGGARNLLPGLVWGYRFDVDGEAHALDPGQPIDLGRVDGTWLWLHLDLLDTRVRAWIRAEAEIPDVAKQLLLSQDVHQQLHAEGASVWGVFVDLVRDIGKTTDQIGHLYFIANEHFIISGRRRHVQSAETTRQVVESGRRFGAAAALLEAIVEHVADAFDTIATELNDKVDDFEEQSLSSKSKALQRISVLPVRRTAVRLHRQLSSLRLIFHRFEREQVKGLPAPLRLAASALAQRLDNLDHVIHAIQDRCRLLQEEINARQAAEANRHLYILSVLTALLLPPTLVTGIFGMNTKDLPLTQTDGGYLLAFGLMAVSSALVYILIRRMRRAD